ncbi:kinesin with motor region at N-terminus [Schizophyllum commune Tattone D]|nr:kinesin with motor region at N-terminus [Schizophyllum commune Tattone D]
MASAKIGIIARVRPALPHEIDDGSVVVQNSGSGGSIHVYMNDGNKASKQFKFTNCYGADSRQEDIFNNDIEPMLPFLFDGITITIFAYGVTSSGKTHTIQGTAEQPGVIKRVVEKLCYMMDSRANANISMNMQYMEIYKDEVYDLLVPNRELAPKLEVREFEGKVLVPKLSRKRISTEQEFHTIYQRASNQRSVGSTKLNSHSSRSHAILSLHIDIVDPASGKTLTGTVNLVDLAGSENNKHTGNDANRLIESSAINKSLSTLGKVIDALNRGESRIPYRDSKLTRVLQDALGGSSMGLLICNIAPGAKFRKDTLNTLNFAAKARDIENKVTINERETKPLPKPHFAALTLQPTAAKPATTVVQAINGGATINNGSHDSRPPIHHGRPSMLPKVPRASMLALESNRHPVIKTEDTSGEKRLAGRVQRPSNTALPPNLNTQVWPAAEGNIQQMIQAEVAKLVAPKEAENRELERRVRELEEERRQAREYLMEHSRTRESMVKSEQPDVLPPDIAAMLASSDYANQDLIARLDNLEAELRSKNNSLYDELTPMQRKTTCRAYLYMARQYESMDDLDNALALYRKAQTYAPDNDKLRDRWILFVIRVFLHQLAANRILDTEYKLKNKSRVVEADRSPKKKRRRRSEEEEDEGEEGSDSAEKGSGRSKRFGNEITNQGSSPKRKRLPEEGEEEYAETPQKRQRGMAVAADDDDDYVPRARRSKRQQAKAA